MEVEVEVLDVDDAEARALLLSIDPLARLAETDAALLDELRRLTTTESDALAELWRSIDAADAATRSALSGAGRGDRSEQDIPEQFLILVECADEQQQTELLARFAEEGLKCRALVS